MDNQPSTSLGQGPHDARTGFHDIKPPPVFLAPDHTFVMFVVLITAILAYLMWRIFSRWNNIKKSTPPIAPEDKALLALRKLDQNRRLDLISMRDYGTGVSCAIREYLEQTFDFPASEYTTAEISRSLSNALISTFPRGGESIRDEFTSKIIALLQKATLITFGHNVEKRSLQNDPDIEALSSESPSVIKELESQLKRERQRTQSVVDVGRNPKPISEAQNEV